MTITSINITLKRLSDGETSRLKGYATITVDNMIAIHDIKILEGKENKKLFIAFPSRRDTVNNKFLDIVHPINSESREIFETAILDEYNKIIEELDSNKENEN